MPIVFIGTSAVATATSGNVSVTPPTTQTNDIMICALTTRDTVVSTFPAGWGTAFQLNNGTITGHAAWKRAVGAEGAFTITHTGGAHIVSRLAVYRGCVNNGNPFSVATAVSNASSTLCTVSTTTTEPNCVLVFTTHANVNTTGFSNFFVRNTRSNPLLQERFLQNGDSTGAGGNKTILDLADVFQPYPISGLLSSVVSAAAANIAGVVALRPNKAILRNNLKIGRLPVKVALGTS